jgi:CxxC motif-containing protein (DUF1111 family)
MSPAVKISGFALALLFLSLTVLSGGPPSQAQAVLPEAKFVVRDPGVRGGPAGAGGPLSGLNDAEQRFFSAGLATFQEVDSVQGTIPGTGVGLGPRFNLDACAGCHGQPAAGGTSPAVNPQVAVATKGGATNHVPSFITVDGPVREVRFKFKRDGSRDGGVHDLYTIAGRADAPGCVLAQPDFKAEQARHNLIFRIPTPLFGGGLIDAIPDSAILANMAAEQSARAAMGITGHPNRNGPGHVHTSGSPNTSGNDGSITRFGWKAQNKSLVIFAGEAYNVETGVTNELFQTERDETPSCLFNATPEDHTTLDASQPTDVISDVMKFAFFMRFLAAPTPIPDTPSIAKGRALFSDIGCALCHTPSLPTGKSATEALRDKTANLYSDLLLHHMGPGLADGIIQGSAGPDEFRTAPLWGLGQRIFFLHDGRTKDLLDAIRAHASHGDKQFPPSEANKVIAKFKALQESEKQDVLNFLRGL